MKKIFLVFCLTLSLFVVSCSRGYFVEQSIIIKGNNNYVIKTFLKYEVAFLVKSKSEDIILVREFVTKCNDINSLAKMKKEEWNKVVKIKDDLNNYSHEKIIDDKYNKTNN